MNLFFLGDAKEVDIGDEDVEDPHCSTQTVL